jgi:hypothetical protein
VRLLFALALGLLALLLIGVLLLVRPAWSETRCTTYEEQTLVVSLQSIDEKVTKYFGWACGRYG